MEGEIWVESEPGVGSCFGFAISLPTAAEEVLPDAPHWIAAALLVMPDDLNRSILAKRLIALGIEVTESETVEAGQGLSPGTDVIFVDQKLIRADMAEMCANAPAPVITVSDPLAGDLACNEERILQRPHSRPALMAQLAALPEPQLPGFRSIRSVVEENLFVGDDPADDEPEMPEGNLFGLSEPEGAAPAPVTTPRRMRVLVAEDNKTNRFVFSKLVKACDIDLTFAENGFEAVDEFEGQQPDLIFMDISMPGMDGKEATRKIRALESEHGLPHTRIVALTAHAMTGDGEEIMAHGLDAHLTKPFPKADILAEIVANCPTDALPALPDADQAQAAS
jgi:CheY-like chemotaxis protein